MSPKAPRTVLTIGAPTPAHPYGAVRQILVQPDNHNTLLVPWVWGWKAIAEAVGVSERHAKSLGSSEAEKPLPIIRLGGRVAMAESSLRSWQAWHEVQAETQACSDAGSDGTGTDT